MKLSDPASERAVLAGIFHYGKNAYYDVADLVNNGTFTVDSNEIIYTCLKHAIENQDVTKPDVPIILSAANSLGLSHLFQKTSEIQHLSAVTRFPVEISNVRKFAAKIRKLQIARLLYHTLNETSKKYLNVTGEETISHILGIAEEDVFQFNSLINETSNEPTKILDTATERIKQLKENPVEAVGISTGFPRYDYAIGSGLRKGSVNVLAARPKEGKSTLGNNIAVHVAKNLQIPVLNLDTEMNKEVNQTRVLACLTQTPIDQIETGKFSKNQYKINQLETAAESLKNIPYYYQSICGMPFEEQINLMRRWIIREVGLNNSGTANDCLIIYDYLKLMHREEINDNVNETQAIGFMMTNLNNFALKYEFPILAFIQLNRASLTREDTSIIATSDRAAWFATNVSIFKRKSDEEMDTDGMEYGTHKLVPMITRYGAGLANYDYINMKMNGATSTVEETLTASEIRKQKQEQQVDFNDSGRSDNPNL